MSAMLRVYQLVHRASLLRCRATRTIFSLTGKWPGEYNAQIAKDIERYWGPSVTKGERKLPQNKSNDKCPKCYIVPMFPYPSGKLHLGHMRVYSVSDSLARYRRLAGFDVIHPIGFDSFGLPAENAARQHGVSARKWTETNITEMKEQLQRFAFAFDWEREVRTSDASYYRFTQSLFLKLYHAGLAYRSDALVNWDPVDQTVLADEQVDEAGISWRSGVPVEKRYLRQWFFRITAFSERLRDSLAQIDASRWHFGTLERQRGWLGELDGVRLEFLLNAAQKSQQTGSGNVNAVRNGDKLSVFSRAPALLHGVTHIVICTKHPLYAAVRGVKSKDEGGRFELLDLAVKHPLNGRVLPVVAEHTRSGYLDYDSRECDARLGVPSVYADDIQIARTFGFKFDDVRIFEKDLNLEFTFVEQDESPASSSQNNNAKKKSNDSGKQKSVVANEKRLDRQREKFEKFKRKQQNVVDVSSESASQKRTREHLETINRQRLRNSGQLDGLTVAEAFDKVAEIAKRARIGGYRCSIDRRDWLVSRQRNWGTPIPIVHCSSCGEQAVAESQLPVLLPEDCNKGDSDVKDPYATQCPKCGGAATRERDTLDTFVDSAWYFMRYLDPQNTSDLCDKKLASRYMPVDIYIGGIEHAILHLYFARFVSHFLHDLGYLPHPEPFNVFLPIGVVKAASFRSANGGRYYTPKEVRFVEGKAIAKDTGEELKVTVEKMSKSKLNGRDPDELVERYGVDTTRLALVNSGNPDLNIQFEEESQFAAIVAWQCRLFDLLNSFMTAKNSIASQSGRRLRSSQRSQPADADSQLTADSGKRVMEGHEKTLADQRNKIVSEVTHFFSRTYTLSSALNRLQFFTKCIQRFPFEFWPRSVELERSIATLCTLLYPVAPSFSSELWSMLRSSASHLEVSRDRFNLSDELREQKWPVLDDDANVGVAVRYRGSRVLKLDASFAFLRSRSAEEILDWLVSQDRLIAYLRANQPDPIPVSLAKMAEQGLMPSTREPGLQPEATLVSDSCDIVLKHLDVYRYEAHITFKRKLQP